MKPIVRAFSSNDVAQTHSVFYQAVHQGAAHHYSQTQRNAWAPSVAAKPSWGRRLSAMTTLVAEQPEHPGRIIGFMGMDHDGHLDTAYVLPDYMGQGIAQQLYNALLSRPTIAALPRLWTEASLLARPFFSKNHWQCARREFHRHNGQVFERYRMFLIQ